MKPRLKTLKPRIGEIPARIHTIQDGSWRADKRSASARGYGRAWQKAREDWLRAHPLCQCPECDDGRIRVTAATVVDHKIPHRGDMKLFWDSTNWQSMAKPCHDKKTATEDGGFGR